MSTNVQALLLDLINDMSQTQGLKTTTMEVLQGRRDFISGIKLVVDGNEIREVPLTEVTNQKRKLGFFLEGILEAFTSEDPMNLTGVEDVYAELARISPIDGPKNTGDRLLAALQNEQFSHRFFALFETKITTPKNQQPHFIFPSIAENQDNIAKFKLLFNWCVTHAADLECAEIKPVLNIPIDLDIDLKKGEPFPERKRRKLVESSSSTEDQSYSDSESESGVVLLKYVPKNTAKKEAPETSCCSPISMMVLGGFIAVLGAAAIALAFALLMGTGVGTALVIGGAVAVVAGTISTSIGFFKHCQRNTPPKEQELVNFISDSEETNDEPSSDSSLLLPG